MHAIKMRVDSTLWAFFGIHAFEITFPFLSRETLDNQALGLQEIKMYH